MKPKIMLQTGYAFCKDLLFPRRCPYCDRVIGFGSCERCPSEVPRATRAAGVPVPKQGHMAEYIDAVYAPFWYRSPIRRAVWDLKFHGRLWLVSFYARQMADTLRADARGLPYTCIVPVPTTRREHRSRDNVPLLLAQALAKELALPLHTGLLCKMRETKRQTELPAEERRSNVKDAFSVQPQTSGRTLQGETVLLVDDIYTTGATVDECARALKAAGAAACGAVCIAEANDF